MKAIKNILLMMVLAFMSASIAYADNMQDAKRAVSLREYQKAYSIYYKLSKNNNAEAQYRLASMYKSGRGVSENIDSAKYWYDKSARNGYVKAQYSLAGLYEEYGEIKKSNYWYMQAAKKGDRRAQKKIIELSKDDVLDKNENHYAMLERAIIKRDYQLIDELLSKKLNLNKANKYGKTPLIIAVEQADIKSVKKLLMKSVKIDHKDVYGDNALLIAARLGAADIVNSLVLAKAKVNTRDKLGNTSLMLSASNGDKRSVLVFLKNKAALELRNKSEKKAIDLASQNKHADVVALLASHGSKVTVKDKPKNNKTLASLKQIRSMRSADKTKDQAYVGWSDLMIASWLGQSVVVAKLLKINPGAINDQDNEKHSALSRAVIKGNAKVVAQLLKAGANTELKHKSGRTALLWAVEAEHIDVLKLLLDGGANINALTNLGDGALHLSVTDKSASIGKLLIKYSVNINEQNKNKEKEKTNKNKNSMAIYDTLRDMAISFKFTPGERINESELYATLGVSRTPIREAMQKLVSDNILRWERNKGFFCRTLEGKEIFDLYQFRRLIEAEVVHPKFDEEDFNRLKKQQLESVKAQEKQPVPIANMVYSRLLYIS